MALWVPFRRAFWEAEGLFGKLRLSVTHLLSQLCLKHLCFWALWTPTALPGPEPMLRHVR